MSMHIFCLVACPKKKNDPNFGTLALQFAELDTWYSDPSPEPKSKLQLTQVVEKASKRIRI